MNRSALPTLITLMLVCALLAVACGPAAPSGPATAASPTRPVEFVISTEPGGGSDIYARFIQGVIEKNKLSPQPFLAVNKPGGAGAVAFQYVFEKKGDMHYTMITLNSFFTTLIGQKLPFQYTDFTPIANLALDPFFLWVNEDAPWKTAGDFTAAAKANALTVTGTGSKQEDEVLFSLIQAKSGAKPFKYVPQSGGGAVAAALAGKQADATVNNPSEGLSFYQASPRKLRPICTFANSSPTAGPYKDLPTCKSQGLDVGIEYFIMRSVMGPPGLTPEQVKFHVDLLKKVYDSTEWRDFAEKNVLDLKFLAGADFQKFLDDYNKLHLDVMKQAGWIQ
ncbi:MAG: tripartite tricarboxylate transporter substrate binding protein [Chloroflexi bacterium]|nr:tripartite tricarboxylate transporter substrate binding protein [Chloroflexota bacterium]MBI3732011.1 tripartite tricarboxylate transporter substrate binding protein [Chloroflexota bacterium]